MREIVFDKARMTRWLRRLCRPFVSTRASSRTVTCQGRPAALASIAVAANGGQTLETRVLLDEFVVALGIPDGDPGSLRETINRTLTTGEDDIITLQNGVYQITEENPFNEALNRRVQENGNVTGDIDIFSAGGNTLTIRGAGAGLTFIEQTVADRVFDIFDGAIVIFEDLTIRNGNAGRGSETNEAIGGAIKANGSIELDGVTLESNTAAVGGAIFVGSGESLTVSNSLITNNSARSDFRTFVTGFADDQGGGIFGINATVSITDSVILSNRADRNGGGIATIGSQVTLEDTDLLSNDAGNQTFGFGDGGGLFAATGGNGPSLTVSIRGGRILNNETGNNGGGVWTGPFHSVTVDGTTISQNLAFGQSNTDGGGGIYTDGATLRVRNAFIEENQAAGSDATGGGIHSPLGNLFVSNTRFDGNLAARSGGAIEVGFGPVTIENNSVLINNRAFGDNDPDTGNGGGLHVAGNASVASTINVFDSYVGRNQAAGTGGGIWNPNNATLNLFNVFIDSNIATGIGGGGIYNDGGFVNVSTMFVSGNEASGESGLGGGILTVDEDNAGAVVLGNVTVQGNFASAGGGGLATVDGALAIDNSAVLGNSTSDTTGRRLGNGGGLFVGGTTASVGITGTEVTGNFASSGGGGIFVQGGNSVAVFGSFVQNNFAELLGGGLFNTGGSIFFDSSVVQNNTAGSFGGGIANLSGAVGLNASAVFANSAGSLGGGIYNSASLFMNGGQLTNNGALFGGGLFNDLGGATFLDNVIVASNILDDIFDV